MILDVLVAGWVGGVVGCLTSYPLDTAKTLRQLHPQEHPSIRHAITRVLRTGGPTAFYRGALAPVLGVGVLFAVCFGAYEVAQRALAELRRGYASSYPTFFLSQPNPLVDAALCGGVAAVFSSLIQGPVELLKVRQQSSLGPGGMQQLALRAVIADVCDCGGGRRGLLKGTLATMAREVPGTAVWFAVYEGVRAALATDPARSSAAVSLTAGAMAGASMWVCVMPVDAVKTLHQAGSGQRIMAVARDLLRREGIAGFYRGLLPAVARAAVSNAATFVTRDAVLVKMQETPLPSPHLGHASGEEPTAEVEELHLMGLRITTDVASSRFSS